jgi:hypothetical protein
MAAVLTFKYDCGYEISIPASRTERQELVSLLEDVADQRHERECPTCLSHPTQPDGPSQLPVVSD